MTRFQIITRLRRQLAEQKRNHKSTAAVRERLEAAVTRDLIAYVKARKRARRANA